MTSVFEHLNNSDERLGPAENEAAADMPRRRVLHRLGEYIELIIKPLNMRPRTSTLIFEDSDRVEVRVSTETTHVIVVIAPETDLSAELYFMRALSGRHLPIPRLIAADMSCAVLPFTYIIQGFIAGSPLSTLDDAPRVRVAARQIGRMLRQAHQLHTPGFGRPTPAGRWSSRGWSAVLGDWLSRRGVRSHAVELLGEEVTEELWAATVEHAALHWNEPRLIHGAVDPARALVTVGSAAHVEALVRPGDIIGGDPLFDLAHATLPRYPAPFQQGIYEGYTAAGMLSAEQHDRLQRLRLLLHVADVFNRNDELSKMRLPTLVADALRQLAPAEIGHPETLGEPSPIAEVPSP